MRALVIVGGLLAAASASACLNDFEVRRAEQAFRAAYADAPPDRAPLEASHTPSHLATATGALLLALALVVAARSPT